MQLFAMLFAGWCPRCISNKRFILIYRLNSCLKFLSVRNFKHEFNIFIIPITFCN